jgi:hypothetical protein
MRDGLSHRAIEIQSIQPILIYAKSLNQKAQNETGSGNPGGSAGGRNADGNSRHGIA